MEKIVVGISGVNAVDNPGPGVGIARSLKEDISLNLTIVGLAYDGMEPGIYMDWLIDKSYIMPYPSGGYEPFIERLIYIRDNSGLNFVIPAVDSELPLYLAYKEEIESYGIKTFLPTMSQFKLRGKDQLESMARAIGIEIPETVVVNSHEELTKAVKEIGLPVMIKGALYGAFRVHTFQESTDRYNQIVAEWGYPVIVQQAVTGEEMNLVGVGDGEGNSLGSITIKKMWKTWQGKIWTGVTINNPTMTEAARKFLKMTKWKSAFELESVFDGEKFWLIEINPRFPAWCYFAAGVGVNLPANMLRYAYGLPLQEDWPYETGKLYIRYTYELISDIEPFQKISTLGEI